MTDIKIHSAAGLSTYIQEIGFLPLLDSGIAGYSADALVDSDCRYVVLPDGGWDWPLWKWKGPIVTDGSCVYGKFFAGKAGFISRQWWPHFYNYRRAHYPTPAEGSIEESILMTLRESGSLITRDLRAACGFTGTNMRGKFDAYITRMQMSCHIVTEDFVYPRDKHNHEYGWGWALLTTPEQLLGRDACQCEQTPTESVNLILDHLTKHLPGASRKQIAKIIE